MKRQTGRSPLLAVLTVVALLLWASGPASAADATWNGGTAFWNVAGNWSGGAVPNGAYDVFIGTPAAVGAPRRHLLNMAARHQTI